MRIIILILLACLPARAVTNLFTGQSITNGMVLTSVVSAESPANTNYFFQENFEVTGYQNTWTQGGATPYANPDTNSPVMQGTNCCEIGLATNFNYTASEFSAKDEVYGKFMVNKSDPGSGQNNSAKLTLSRLGVANDCEIAFQAGGIVGVTHGGIGATADAAMGLGTNYFCWFHFAKGTGANGVLQVFVSISDSKPGTPLIDLSTGSGTASPSAVSIQGTAELAYFDDIKLSTTGYPTP